MLNQPGILADIIPIAICIIVIGIILFSFFITIRYRDAEQFKKTRISVFFSTLASLAILFVGFNIFLSTLSFEANQRFARLTKTKEAVDKLWLYPNELLKTSHNIRPEFRASFFMFNRDLYNRVILPNTKALLTDPGLIEEQFIATVMIQAWSDCLALRHYDLASLRYWFRGFLTWAQNPYFKAYYANLRFQYADSTVQIADLLFEYAEKIPVPTLNRAIYQDLADKIMADERYKALIKSLP